jgi:hypothetical protein
MYESTDFSEFLPFCQEAMTEGWRALSFRNVLEVVGVTPLGVMIMYLSMSLLALLRCTLHTHTHPNIIGVDHVPVHVAARLVQVCQLL